MLSQEWAATRTILHLPNGYITEGTQRFTMRSLLMCYYFRGVAGKGVGVCHHSDWKWSSPTILRRWQLARKLSYNALPVNCEQDWNYLPPFNFCHSIWWCTIYWGATFQLPGNFNSWHHGLMSNSWIRVSAVALHQMMKKLNQLNYILQPWHKILL